jgi:site-specific DNA recombinase
MDRRQTFARHVVDDVQHAETATAGELVVDEIQRPPRVGLRLDQDRRSRSDRSSPRLPFAHAQTFFAVRPIDAIDARRLAALPQQDEEPPVAKARATKFWTRRRPRHLLTEKVVCGVCGGPASSIGKDYIACSTARRQGTCVNRASIRRSEIETWIMDALQRQLMAPDLVSEFVRAHNDEINKSRRDRDQRREALMREEKELARRIDNLLDAVASGDLRGPTVQAKLEAFEERKLKASEERAGLSDEPVRLHPNLAAAYKAKVASLQTLLQQEATRAEAMEIIRSLIDQVILRPTAEGQLEIELVGDLANMVHLAQELDGSVPTRGAVRDEFARSIKVVAGAGFEPATFRL